MTEHSVQSDEAARRADGARTAAPRAAAFRVFRGTFATWDGLFSQATEFASGLGPERVINISHSADGGEGVVTVWYWS